MPPAKYVPSSMPILALVTRGGKVTQYYSPAEQFEWQEMLTAIAVEHGYKPGWVAHKFSREFGNWPAHNSAPPLPSILGALPADCVCQGTAEIWVGGMTAAGVLRLKRQPATMRSRRCTRSSSLHEEMQYDTDPARKATSATEAFALKRGVSQDLAHVFIAASRSLGIPARCVGGYFFRDDGAAALDAV
jgi:hypothetical protein